MYFNEVDLHSFMLSSSSPIMDVLNRLEKRHVSPQHLPSNSFLSNFKDCKLLSKYHRHTFNSRTKNSHKYMHIPLNFFSKPENSFNEDTAEELCAHYVGNSYRPLSDYSALYLQAVQDNLVDWREFFKGKLGTHKIDVIEPIFRAIQENNLDVLDKLISVGNSQSLTRSLSFAIEKNRPKAVSLLLPFANLLSQNSYFLQSAARILDDNEALLGLLIPSSNPNKAVRHLIYIRDNLPADNILSHPATSMEILTSSLEFASSRQLPLPKAQARLLHQNLTYETMSSQKNAQKSNTKKM